MALRGHLPHCGWHLCDLGCGHLGILWGREFGLFASNSSLGMTGGVGAEQGSSGIQVSCLALIWGSGTRVDM